MTAMLGPLLRMVVSLAVVLALMYIAARLLSRGRGVKAPARPRVRKPRGRSMLSALASGVSGAGAVKHKRGRRSARPASPLEVVARQPLGKTASVAVVRVADRTLLLGITDSDVRLLSEFDRSLFEEVEDSAEESAPADGTAAADARQVSVPSAGAGIASLSFLDALRERTVRRA